MSAFSDDMTIRDARETLRPLAESGHECPVCKQHVRIYRRKLTSVVARSVGALYREHGRGFGRMAAVARKHLPDVASQGGYLVLAAHWGLLEDESLIRRDVGRTGYWRVTELGEQWLAGQVPVPMYARIYNGRCLALEGDLVRYDDVRSGEGFDFRELMAARATAPPSLFDAVSDREAA